MKFVNIRPYLVDPVGDLLYVEGPPDGPVLVDDVDGHLAPPRPGGVHGEGERVAGNGATGLVLVRDLEGEKKDMNF